MDKCVLQLSPPCTPLLLPRITIEARRRMGLNLNENGQKTPEETGNAEGKSYDAHSAQQQQTGLEPEPEPEDSSGGGNPRKRSTIVLQRSKQDTQSQMAGSKFRRRET